MGLSCCYRRRKNRRPLLPLYLRPSSPLPNHPSSSSSNLPIPVPRRPPPSSPPRNPPSSSSSTPPIPVPRPPPRTYAFTDPALYPPPIKVRPNNPPFNPYQNTKWAGSRPEALPPPPPYVDLQSTVKLKHDVNVRKDTIRVDLDENNLNSYLVSFTFDALADGSITIFYFAKEGDNGTITPVYPEIYKPVRIPFREGRGQKFCQPSGTGIDLGLFDNDDLSSPKEYIFPLVIHAVDEQLDQALPTASLIQAVLEKNNEGHFQVRVVKQILWVDSNRYELQEIYGFNKEKECLICTIESMDTTVLPCRHMCMCSGCAKKLRLQSTKCPICRQPIERFMQIKVD